MGLKLGISDWIFLHGNKNLWFQTFALFWMFYAFFWVIPRRLNFIYRRFGRFCLFHLHRQCSETSAYKIQKPGNYPEESIQQWKFNLITVQQDATVFSFVHYCRQLYMFRVLTPIIRSSYNCNYSFWYWLTAIRCY